jgi:hypothetical protein
MRGAFLLIVGAVLRVAAFWLAIHMLDALGIHIYWPGWWPSWAPH